MLIFQKSICFFGFLFSSQNAAPDSFDFLFSSKHLLPPFLSSVSLPPSFLLTFSRRDLCPHLRLSLSHHFSGYFSGALVIFLVVFSRQPRIWRDCFFVCLGDWGGWGGRTERWEKEPDVCHKNNWLFDFSSEFIAEGGRYLGYCVSEK